MYYFITDSVAATMFANLTKCIFFIVHDVDLSTDRFFHGNAKLLPFHVTGNMDHWMVYFS